LNFGYDNSVGTIICLAKANAAKTNKTSQEAEF